MKYLNLYENWNPLSAKAFAEARELHQIGVVSDQELSELRKLKRVEQKILQYTGVGDLNLNDCLLLKTLPDGLVIGGGLYLAGCTGLESLPVGLTVNGDLDLEGCTGLKSLPAGLKIERYLYLYGCIGIDELPQDLKIGGQVYW